jgi:BirA family transcriptional regulator, biotin operon repressor / biotin---[acetyl-CoA-carboxylase] ligase
MSVEALASAWARTENAPDGSIVVADSEISGRLRGGTPWRAASDDALIMAMVIRPTIDPLQEALLWLVASLGTANALANVTGNEHTTGWPDTVTRSDGDAVQSLVNVTTQLGPGRVEHAVLAVRTHLDGLDVGRDQLLGSLEQQLQAAARLVEQDSLALLEAFNDRCSAMNRRARASLLPRGEARGRVTAVDRDGFLVLESSTGMLERIAPASLRSLEFVD